MKFLQYTIVSILLIACSGSIAQTIRGKVLSEKNETLAGANVHFLGTQTGTFTKANGEFEISTEGITNKKLVVSFIGFNSDTVDVTNKTSFTFKLKSSQTLGEVVVKEQLDGVLLSDLTTVKTEILTQVELQKTACCDLAGCFETQSSVQPHTTNIITNSKELRILGLSGVYNQVLIDGFPMINGLSYTYGISGIPGTLVDNIFIAKGANSVLQGFESISGQINVETKEPEKSDKFFLNIYTNSFWEKHFNTNFSYTKNKWSGLTAFHAVRPSNKVDRDKDSFLDLPLLTRNMIFNKWKYGSENEKGLSSKIGIRYLNEQRTGGQTFFNAEVDKGSTSIYGQSVKIEQPEVWTKTTYRFTPTQRVNLLASSFYQNQKSFFGTVKYDAEQISFYSNVQYELDYAGKHSIKTGLSYRYLNLDENIRFTETKLSRTYAGNYLKEENIPGVFAENTMKFFNEKLTWIAGVRSDLHNEFGNTITPRTFIKYDIADKTIIRGSAGTGWRTVNLFSENIGLLVSSRDVKIEEALRPEEAVNMGVNITRKFEGKNFSGYFSTDYYRTDFQNQIFPDYDTDPKLVLVKNYTGTSVSNSYQSELYLKLHERFEFKAGYNLLDVFRKSNEIKEDLPFNPKHKILTTLGYKPLTEKFHVDVNVHWFGAQRLPDTKGNPAEFQQPDYSKSYTIYNSQFTYDFKIFEAYIGCENIFDYRQKKPKVSWQNPFGPYFDTSSVWGPTKGREIYVGVRIKIEKE